MLMSVRNWKPPLRSLPFSLALTLAPQLFLREILDDGVVVARSQPTWLTSLRC